MPIIATDGLATDRKPLSSLNSWAFLVPSWKRIWIFVLALETSTLEVEKLWELRLFEVVHGLIHAPHRNQFQSSQSISIATHFSPNQDLCTHRAACQKQTSAAQTELLQRCKSWRLWLKKQFHHIFGTSTATMQRFKACQSQICQQPLNTAGTFDIAKVFEMWNSQALGNIGQRPSESQPEHRKSICTGAKPFYDSKPDHDLPVGDLRPGSPLVNDLPMYICQYVHQKKRLQRCNVSIYTRILLCSAVLLAGISTLSGARSPWVHKALFLRTSLTKTNT